MLASAFSSPQYPPHPHPHPQAKEGGGGGGLFLFVCFERAEATLTAERTSDGVLKGWQFLLERVIPSL